MPQFKKRDEVFYVSCNTGGDRIFEAGIGPILRIRGLFYEFNRECQVAIESHRLSFPHDFVCWPTPLLRSLFGLE